ncbi:helix-turn-helix domain-containing protein [Streptomyces sp. PTM05]|uniref:Helix-turn-helix domain-containing protein n=1 Tax=Streptantibioticus parmotrematis TaxID=2873249 RepID=A0ABS7QPD4_9ACTN|nr:Scr1 family TA system antitoxin-like transcriptional regulator [Streptantibioticus parmotrematis]MBY8884793.1 helix-turn-helix domain-containing protein [Streptantibioticus parmotrematis]
MSGSFNLALQAAEALRMLGQDLREVQKNSGMTGRSLASAASWHESKVSRLENGRSLPQPADIRAWILLCGAEDRADELLGKARAIERDQARHRWARPGAGNARWQKARSLRLYAPSIVPECLRTAAYHRAVLPSLSSADASVVPQALPDHADIHVIVEEDSITRRIGDAAVLAGQVEHLLSLAASHRIRLGVIPRETDRTTRWRTEPFTIIDDEQVHLVLTPGPEVVRSTTGIAAYEALFNEYAAVAEYSWDGYGRPVAAARFLS